MTTPLNGSNVPSHRGPRYARRADLYSEASAEFRAHTEGLTYRLPLPSLKGMRAGTVLSPHALVRRYLVSARQIGLPKEWALRLCVWLQRQVDALWPMDATPRRTLEEKAMLLEHVDNCAEKKLDLETNAIAIRQRIQTQSAEVVADMLVLAKLERELEDCL